MSDFTRSGFDDSIQQQLKQLSADTAALRRSLYNLEDRLDAEIFAAHEFMWKSEIGIDFESAKLVRTFPVRIYLQWSSDTDPYGFGFPSEPRRVVQALINLLAASEFELRAILPDEAGSFIKRLTVATKALFSKKEVLERFEKAAQAIDLATIGKPQAEIDKLEADAAKSVAEAERAQAESEKIRAEAEKIRAETALMRVSAAVDLAAALESYEGATIQAGYLVGAKTTLPDGQSRLLVRTLSDEGLKQLEGDAAKYMIPQEATQLLQDWSRESSPDSDK